MTAASPSSEPDDAARETNERGSRPPRKFSREFVWAVCLVVVIALGAFVFRGWQYRQAAPDLNAAMDFIKTNLEPSAEPHIPRAAISGQVAAFYRENGPVESVLWSKVDSRDQNPFGEPVCVTKTEVKTRNGPVLVTIKVKNHNGERSIVSVVYQPESDSQS